MSSPLAYLMLAGGCIYLLIGGDFLVRGALALAHRLSISPVIVGLTIVAAGTSAPELLVSVHAALNGFPGIAIGNVVGSNIANALLVVGVPALIHPIVATDSRIKRQALFMVSISIMFAVMCFIGHIDQIDGWLLLGIMATGIVLTLKGHTAMPGLDLDDAEQQMQRVIGLPETRWGISALVLLGAGFLPVGAELAVAGAVEVASDLGVSEAAIGSTLIALGTSLPELSTTLIAAFRRHADIALGNVIGSNVLNILAIMGITAVLVDVPVPSIYLQRDLWVMIAGSIAITVFIVRNKPITRGTGLVLCGGYAAYCAAVL